MKLSDEDIEAMQRQNDALNKHFAKVFGDIFPSYTSFRGLAYDDGTAVQFNLGSDGHKNPYRYYEDENTKARYCYTPWKDTRGFYWAFTYAPRGKGSRSGDPERLTIVDAVKFRKRKAAKSRARARFEKA